MKKKILLVVPVYNEELAIPIFYRAVRGAEFFSRYDVEIVFINDGSSDNTENIIEALSISDPLVKAESFTRNFGKEAALMAGLNISSGDAVIPIDVDLQDPIEVIPQLIEKWLEGADVVLAKRANRDSDTWLKRNSAKLFYKFHNKISDIAIEENVGDFRLLTRPVVNEIAALPEHNLFMKGLLSWVGGNVAIVEYTRAARSAGETKFNAWKLWNLALEGITNFSTALLKIWTYIGMIIAMGAFVYGAYRVVDTLLYGNDVSGYSSIIVSIVFIGGIQLIGIGVLGEYIGRIYIETKNRPRYILKSDLDKSK